MLVRPDLRMSSEVMVRMGTCVAMSAPLMREPVTSTASSLVACLLSVGLSFCWACTAMGSATNAHAMATASRPRRGKVRFMIDPLVCMPQRRTTPGFTNVKVSS